MIAWFHFACEAVTELAFKDSDSYPYKSQHQTIQPQRRIRAYVLNVVSGCHEWELEIPTPHGSRARPLFSATDNNSSRCTTRMATSFFSTCIGVPMFEVL